LKKKLDRIDEALVGPDGTGLNSGVVKLLTDLRNDFNNYKKEAEGKRRQRNAYLVPLITGIGVFAICEVISLVLIACSTYGSIYLEPLFFMGDLLLM